MKPLVYLAALGSGSKGNAFVLSRGGDSILIDAGFSRKVLLERMERVGVDPGTIRAVCITHEHDDHVKGARVFCDSLKIPVYATCGTARKMHSSGKLPAKVVEFEPGACFERYGFEISAFSVQHDADDPVGFTIRVEGVKIGFATDLGKVNSLAKARLANCDTLILESNYDDEMLMNSDREFRLKQRIRGANGHLSNALTAAVLPELLGGQSRRVLLAHISGECNTYELAYRSSRGAIDGAGRGEIELGVIRQDEPLPRIELAND
jgi:phosphoribosyl 1,2-cyclic phosphodiesterase